MNLIVFETDELEKDFVLNNDIPQHTDTASVQCGVGSIIKSLKDDEVYETVLFIRHNYWLGDYTGFVFCLNRFIRELYKQDMINDSTKLI
jgi:hypothetical protein